jgi:hypothetical protein
LSVLASFDNTVRNKVTGLQAGQTYFYQFIAGDVRSNVGRFKTAPASNADVAQLQFAYLTCQDWSVNHWGAMDYIAKNENLDFIIHLGDYIYETVGAAFQTGNAEARHTALQLPDGTALLNADGTTGKAKYATTLPITVTSTKCIAATRVSKQYTNVSPISRSGTIMNFLMTPGKTPSPMKTTASIQAAIIFTRPAAAVRESGMV